VTLKQPIELPTLDRQRDYYTGRWNDFAYADALDLTRMVAVMRAMESLQFSAPPVICDLGCGAGWTAGILSCFGPTLGVDLSDTSAAARQFPRCKFVSANVLEWDYPKSEFDVVTSVEVLEHIDAALQEKYIQVAHDLLRPGGHFILTTPNASTMAALPGGGTSYTNQPVEAWVSRTELSRLLRSRFELLTLTSIVYGFGTHGSYRVVNSHKLQMVLASFGLRRPWQQLALRLGYGLHLVAHARKRA
jgi:2-polyprenyl-3-methyl-5-hydroxy-6-metoxy-1,4-benzoquinol methylase